MICLTTNREKLYKIIDNRVDKMVEEGLLDEAKYFYLEISIGAVKGYLSRGKYGAKTRISFPYMLMIADYVETPLQDLVSEDFAKELELEEIQRQIEELKYLKEKLLREE